MKKVFLNCMLLLCALIVGSGSVWGAPETLYSETFGTTGNKTNVSSYTGFSSSVITPTSSGWKISDSSTTTCNITGTSGSCNAYCGSTSDFIFNFGNKFSEYTDVRLSFNYNKGSANGKANSLKLYLSADGGTTYGSDILPSNTGAGGWYSVTDIVIPAANLANLCIKFASSTNTNRLDDIKITGVYASSDPVINAANVNIDADDTEGVISYTISNPVDGKSLTATITAGGSWLSSPVVDAVNNKVTFTATENTSYEDSREGTIHLVYGDNLATKDVTITQAAAIHKYVVTIETPSNGTLVVKNGETPISTGAQILDGTALTIVTTPADGYRLRNWQAVDATTHTYTASYSYTINAHDVTIRANFELIPEHTATFYINGTKDSETNVKEGADIVFPIVSVAGQRFLGWTTSALDGTQTTKPATLVTEATMGDANVDYYAVFGVALNAFFDASDITKTPKDGSNLKWIHTETGIYISLSAGSHYTTGTPNTFTVTSGTSNYLQVTAPGGCTLEKIVVTITGNNYKINSLNPSSGASLSTSGTTQTVTFTSEKSSIQCKATSNYQIRATTISVKATAYCTSIPTTTISLNAACTDGSLVYGTFSYPKSFVVSGDIEVSEVSIVDGHLYMEEYNTGDVVPANTGVLVSALEADDYPVNLSIEAGESVLGSSNMLYPGGVTAEEMAAAHSSCKYYKLALEKDGEGYVANTAGFYWGAEGGAAFASSANKAYLAVPTGASAPSHFMFNEEVNGATNIENIEASDKAVKFIENGRILILRDGITYDALGRKIR